MRGGSIYITRQARTIRFNAHGYSRFRPHRRAADARLRRTEELKRVWCVRRKPLEIEDLRAQVSRCAKAARQ
jgi:hypothetical protein